jgi:aspartokinase
MTSITRQVWEILDNDITIRKDLERGIVNVSALSEYLKQTYGIKGSLDSIISAVRRYKVNEVAQDDYKRVRAALKDATVSTKTDIALLTLRNTPNTYKYLAQIMADEDFVRNDVFRLIKRRHDVQLVVDKECMRKAKAHFPHSSIEGVEEGLVEISVTLGKEGWSTKGVLSRIANELATQDVNVELVFSLYPHVSVFIRQKDLVKAHDAVLRISGRS